FAGFLFVPAIGAWPLSLLSRLAGVAVPRRLVLRGDTSQRRRGIAILTWAGLRGGVSIALALILPPSPYRGRLIVVCYAVVVFSMLVQGLTMSWVIQRLYGTRGRNIVTSQPPSSSNHSTRQSPCVSRSNIRAVSVLAI